MSGKPDEGRRGPRGRLCGTQLLHIPHVVAEMRILAGRNNNENDLRKTFSDNTLGSIAIGLLEISNLLLIISNNRRYKMWCIQGLSIKAA